MSQNENQKSARGSNRHRIEHHPNSNDGADWLVYREGAARAVCLCWSRAQAYRIARLLDGAKR